MSCIPLAMFSLDIVKESLLVALQDKLINCKFGNFREGLFSRNGEITLSSSDIGKSCPSREFLTSQICLLMLVAKMKFPNLSIFVNPYHSGYR